MEHIVQFAISIDDKTIQKKLEENAYNDILNELISEWKEGMPKKDTWGYNKGDKIDWQAMTRSIMYDFCQEHKDDIIAQAANNLCDSFRRTKAFKEKMLESMEESDRMKNNV